MGESQCLKSRNRKKSSKLDWKKKRRQEYLEMKQYRYYIFCEGQQTEPLYFAGFKKLIEENPIYKDMVLIEIEPCQAETMRVIGMAEEYVKKNKIKRGKSGAFMTRIAFRQNILMVLWNAQRV